MYDVPVLARISALTALMAFAGLQQQPSNAPAWSVPHVAQPIAVAGSAAAKPQRSPRNANYQIEAALDPVARTITGAETISWRNVATVGAPSLQFHLYYNAWRDNRSSWMRELALAVPYVSADSAGAPRLDRHHNALDNPRRGQIRPHVSHPLYRTG